MIEWKIAAADPRFQITHLDISRQSSSFLSEDTCPLIFPTALIQLIHQQGTGPQSGLISSASPWLQRARLPVQTVWGTLTPLLWKQLSWANQVAPMFERETREGDDSVTLLLEKLEQVGSSACSLSLFICLLLLHVWTCNGLSWVAPVPVLPCAQSLPSLISHWLE